jgi:DNA repair exonuclease SbcCD nuclease subunit
MKLLHTADLHLKKDSADRLEILRWIVEKGNTHEVDLIIIAGDMFDSDADAPPLRSQVKNICKNARASILIIPGNHDSQSFGNDIDYGSNVIQMTDTPFHVRDIAGVIVAAIPFQELSFSECADALPDGIDVLIVHGTLYDPAFIYSVIDDIETKYMPIFIKNIEDRARYIALGHLHSRFIHAVYKTTHVVYPGSPSAIDTKCTSERACALVNLTPRDLTVEQLNVDIAPHYERREFFVFPGNEDKVLENVRAFLKDADPRRIHPYVLLKGYLGQSDKAYQRALDTIKTHYQSQFNDFILETTFESWDTLVQHRIVQKFIAKTETLEESIRLKVYEIAFPVLSKALQ